MPSNPYSASKAGADRLAYSYFATYGVPVLVTRASNNFGPRQYPEKLIPLFITNALDDLALPLYGDGGNVRDWLAVEDTARARRGAGARRAGRRSTTSAAATSAATSRSPSTSSRGSPSRPTLIRHVTDRLGHDSPLRARLRAAARAGLVPARRLRERARPDHRVVSPQTAPGGSRSSRASIASTTGSSTAAAPIRPRRSEAQGTGGGAASGGGPVSGAPSSPTGGSFGAASWVARMARSTPSPDISRAMRSTGSPARDVVPVEEPGPEPVGARPRSRCAPGCRRRRGRPPAAAPPPPPQSAPRSRPGACPRRAPAPGPAPRSSCSSRSSRARRPDRAAAAALAMTALIRPRVTLSSSGGVRFRFARRVAARPAHRHQTPDPRAVGGADEIEARAGHRRAVDPIDLRLAHGSRDRRR